MSQITIMRLDQWDLWNFRSFSRFSPCCRWCRKVLLAGDLVVVETMGKHLKTFYHSACFDVAKEKRSSEHGDSGNQRS